MQRLCGYVTPGRYYGKSGLGLLLQGFLSVPLPLAMLFSVAPVLWVAQLANRPPEP